MAKKVIITDFGSRAIEIQRKVIESAGLELENITPICKTAEDVIRTCGSADVLLVQWAPITREVFQSLPRVKCVVRYGIGVDNVNLEAAKEFSVMVVNVPDYCLEEVSNHAMAMILSLGRRIPHDHQNILKGGWGVGKFMPIPAFTNLTLGLVGFGRIGRLVAAKSKAFGFHIVAYDPLAPDSCFAENGVTRVRLEDLFKTADIISLHCPMVPETRHLINKKTIAQFKPGVLIVNTSRGPLVNEADLVDGLNSGKIIGAGLDVFEKEPLPADSPLRAFSNVILTSHAASASDRAIVLLETKAAEAARDFLLGKRPASVIVDVEHKRGRG